MKDVVTSNQLGKILGISTRRVQQLASDGVLKKVSRGHFQLADAIQKYIAYQLELERRKYKKNDMDINEAKRRKEVAEAELKEIELAVRKRGLIEKDEVISLWQSILKMLRSRLLAIPSKLAPQIIGLENIHEAEKILENHIYEALDEISQARNIE